MACSVHKKSKTCCILANFQVSGEDADDYKRTLRAQLKALIEREKDPLGPTEWVVCYIKPAASDPLSKGPKKVAMHFISCLLSVMHAASDRLALSSMYETKPCAHSAHAYTHTHMHTRICTRIRTHMTTSDLCSCTTGSRHASLPCIHTCTSCLLMFGDSSLPTP